MILVLCCKLWLEGFYYDIIRLYRYSSIMTIVLSYGGSLDPLGILLPHSKRTSSPKRPTELKAFVRCYQTELCSE